MAFGKGSKGAGVKQLQASLHTWIKGTNDSGSNTGLIGLIADGSFGQNTYVALATFQKWNGLSPSGFADEETLSLLGLPNHMAADGSEAFDSTGGGM